MVCGRGRDTNALGWADFEIIPTNKISPVNCHWAGSCCLSPRDRGRDTNCCNTQCLQERTTKETYKRDLQKRPTKETYKRKSLTSSCGRDTNGISHVEPEKIQNQLHKWWHRILRVFLNNVPCSTRCTWIIIGSIILTTLILGTNREFHGQKSGSLKSFSK